MSDKKYVGAKVIQKEPYSSICSFLGLFLPVCPASSGYLYRIGGYGFGWTITVGYVPLGWIIGVVAWLV